MEKVMQKEPNTYIRGIKLEKEFGEWMENELGYEVKYREPVKGQVAQRAYEVDIHGIREDKKMKIIKKLGFLLIFISLLSMIVPELNQNLRNIIKMILPGYVNYSLLIFGIAGFAIGNYAKKKTEKHAWVECKNHKSNVKRVQVQKLISTIEDVNSFASANWHADETIFVSGSNFDHDALNFAEEYGIDCYIKTSQGFEQVL